MNKFFKRGRIVLGATAMAAVMASGCGDSESFVYTNPQSTIAPPIAVNDAFTALGNATLERTAANGVLTNDTLNGAAIISFDSEGSNGGSMVLNNDGSLSYTPVFGFVGAESFGYTIANVSGEATATVTFTSTGSGFFVDNTAADGGDGSQASPFDTLAEAVAAASDGDTVFVSRGNGTSDGLTGAVNLPTGVDLIGEGVGLILAQTIVPAGTAPVIQGPIFCGGDNTISGLTIRGSAESAIEAENVGDIFILNNTIGGSADENIFLTNTTGTVTISQNSFDDPPTADQSLICSENEDTNGNLVISDNTFTNPSNNELDALALVVGMGTSVMDVTVNGNVANGNVANQFDAGFIIVAVGDSQMTATVSDNILNNFTNEPIALVADDPGSSMNGSISGNMISNASSEVGIFGQTNDGDTITISGNVVSDTIGPNIYFDVITGGTFVIENNQLSGSPNDGILFDAGSNGDVKIAVRNNTIDSTPHSIHLDWTGSGDLCAVITGNDVTSDIILDGSGAPGVFSVEQLNSLEFLNTMNGNSVTYNTVDEVDEGECMIP